jgi:hypothetical protein
MRGVTGSLLPWMGSDSSGVRGCEQSRSFNGLSGLPVSDGACRVPRTRTPGSPDRNGQQGLGARPTTKAGGDDRCTQACNAWRRARRAPRWDLRQCDEPRQAGPECPRRSDHRRTPRTIRRRPTAANLTTRTSPLTQGRCRPLVTGVLRRARHCPAPRRHSRFLGLRSTCADQTLNPNRFAAARTCSRFGEKLGHEITTPYHGR